jgi:hypothetical protein
MMRPNTLNTAVKYATISASTAGDNTLLAAQGPGKKIRVVSYVFVASAATTVQFESSTSGPDLTGAMSIAANGGVSAAHNEYGWFETDADALLNVKLSADGIDGHFSYVVITNPSQP